MEQNNKTIAIAWPFWQCKAILPNSLGHDIFVWLYLSLLVHINKVEGKDELLINEKRKAKVRELIATKFSKDIMSDVLISEIEKRIDEEFCTFEGQYNTPKLRSDVMSFLNSFEYLFGNDIEVKSIYKDAISGAIMPYFEDAKSPWDNLKVDFEFDSNIYRPKEPAARLVIRALKLEERAKNTADPLAPSEAQEATIHEFEYDENEEVYEDDTLDFVEAPAEEAPQTYAEVKGKDKKKTVTVLDDSYCLVKYMTLVHADEHGELFMDPPVEFPVNPATTAWFNMLFKRAMLTNDGLKKKIEEAFPKPHLEEKADPQNMLKLFSEKGKLDKCQELYEVVAHSQTLRGDLQLEVIRINDNFYSISGYFHVGRLLDLLGRTIPDTKIRADTLETYRYDVKEACTSLGLSDDDAFTLGDKYIYQEYARPNKNPNKLAFKELFANAIVNNLACENNPFFYKEVVRDVWYLYGMRSKVDHPNGNVRLTEEDVKKLTRLAKFIVSIQGGRII